MQKVYSKKIMRTGVYGVAMDREKILLIRQQRGPYANRFDFPGGGIEFGESIEEALRREFAEEVAMEFDSMQLIGNITAVIDILDAPDPYSFHQIGLIYRLNGCRPIHNPGHECLDSIWIDPALLTEDDCSQLLWRYINAYN